MKEQLEKQDFLSLFRREAEVHIQELNKGLLELESDPKNRAALEEVRRRAHTLKGSAKMMGLTEISNAAHAMEDLLESVRMEMSELNKSVFDTLFRSLDSINVLLQANTRFAPTADEKIPVKKRDSLKAKEPPQDGRIQDSPLRTGMPSKQERIESVAQDAILVKTDKLDSLAGVVSEMVLDQIKSENQTTKISQLASQMREQVRLCSQIREKMSESLNSIAQFNGLQMEEINRYDKLSARTLNDTINLLEDYRRITTHRRLILDQLRNDIRTMRLIPMSSIFDTFPRAVRDLSREYDKEIELKISGAEVELDKGVISVLKDPLMHLVRNAVDHGIEGPEERLRQGKPKTGNISLSVYHQGSKVVIEVSDDGAGIDLDKVKRQAFKMGSIKESQIETMDEDSAIQLIFLPGLSTSSIITDVSGRGVGMDVVRENVGRKLKGTVNVHTEVGKGTEVSLAVPITLAVMRGLLVKAGQGMFAIPTESIEKNVIVPQDQIKSAEGKRVMLEGERIVPLVRLTEVLGVDGTSKKDNSDAIPVVIVNYAQKQIGFCVDGFVSEQEMIIKSMGSYLKRVPNVAGVTILGSGEVIAILHVSDLVNSAKSRFAPALPGLRPQQPVTDQQPPVGARHAVPVPRKILIVEDSLTTRELEKSILEASGYNVHVAVDGLDGLSKVSEREFDLIISDIQMPGMDGFQMVEKLKQNEPYKDIPVIIVTALHKDEEKRRGIEVGASAYIVKSSFDQSALLDTIVTLIG